MLAVDRHVPSRVRLTLPDAATPDALAEEDNPMTDNPVVVLVATVALIALSAFFVAVEFA